MIYDDISIADPEIHELIQKERKRQAEGLELIASENFTSVSVLQANSSILTNKYSEGYPGKRYYGGTQFIDEIEILCHKRALQAFKLDPEVWGVNAQSLSGSPANFAVYTALVGPNGKIMGLDLPSGGHLTHGYQTKTKKISATSLFFESVPYSLNEENIMDYSIIENKVVEFKPEILICGASAYSRDFDYSELKRIADINNSFLMADISHISGLIISGIMKNPFDFCDVVTTTTHKTLRGPRGALIFYKKKKIINSIVINIEEKINSAVFPGLQGGPHNQTISAIAVALKQALSNEYIEYIKQVHLNAKTLSEELIKMGHSILTGGTDCHLILIDLGKTNVTGSMLEKTCELSNISINKNCIPNSKSVLNPKGVRIGTPALTTRGFKEEDFKRVAYFFNEAFKISEEIVKSLSIKNEKINLSDFVSECDKNENIKILRNEVKKFASSFPMPYFDYLKE